MKGVATDDEWCHTTAEIAEEVFRDAIKEFFNLAADAGIDHDKARVTATCQLLGYAAYINAAPSKEDFLEYAAHCWDRAQVEMVFLEGEAVH